MADLKTIKRHREDAHNAGSDHRKLLDELYSLVTPLRRPAGDNTPTGSRFNKAYDLTAPKAAHRFTGRMERDVTPVFQKFFELELGPAARQVLSAANPNVDPDDLIAETNKELEKVSDIVMGILEGSQFQLAAGEMYMDLFGGQGALLMLEDDDEIISFAAVPAIEIDLRENGRGKIVGVYWARSYAAEDLPGMWPEDDTTFSAELQEIIKNNPTTKVEIVQATEWDQKAKAWVFTVYRNNADGEEGAIYELENMRTSPWLTPRFFKVPGEAFGRGVGLVALPTIKTVNKVTELTLKAAAFAILGLWMYRNDRVFNAKTSVMKPGAMWQVSSTGGTLGPAIQKLDLPGRYDVSNVILQDLRDMIKQATLDDTLPPDSGAVRSPTEIVERIKRLQSDLAGAYARLILEIVRPLVQRCIDVAHRRGLIEANLPIDQILLKLKITSPIARTQQAQDISAIVDWLQILMSTVGQEGAALTAKLEDIGAEIGRKLGVPERLIRSKTERGELMKLVAQMIAQSQTGGEQAPPGEEPQQIEAA